MKNTLAVAEWQIFGVDDICEVLESNHKDKAKKYFAELQDFTKGKENDRFLKFWGKNKLKAQNFVGLIQTKSGFCVEILPKTFRREKLDSTHHQTCKAYSKSQIPLDKIQEFATNLLFDNLKANTSKSEISQENNCEICKVKAILLNCLATLKNSPFKQSQISSLRALNLPLLEIFVMMFLNELEKLVKSGIRSDYLIVEQNRTFLKGKLLFKENLKYNLVHKERFFTQSDEFSQDIAPNRLIKSTILLLSKYNFSPKTSAKLNHFHTIFENINESKNIKSDFLKAPRNRHFSAYRLLLAWCELFLQKKIFTPYAGEDSAFALLFDMNVLFESFVAHHLKKQVLQNNDYKFYAQNSEKYFMQENSQNLFILKPDMVIKNENRILILDTKWKILKSRDDKDGVSQGDLYQMWAYASKYALDLRRDSKQDSKENKSLTIHLIYPLCEATQDLCERWKNKNKKWCFKASSIYGFLDSNLESKEQSTQEKLENQQHLAVTLQLDFFPLL